MKNRTQIERVLMLLLAAALSACSGDSGEQVAAPLIRPANIIEITDPAKELTRVFPGVVVSAHDTVLSFRVGGRLTNLPVDKRVGALVESGDVLATLDPVDYKNALSNAEASYELASAQFKRGSELVKDGHVSKTEFDRLKARHLSMQAELNQARTNLDYTELQAPFGGRIARVLVKNHESVQPDQPIAILEDADNIEVEIHVPTAVMAQVSDLAKSVFRARGKGQHIYDVEFENAPDVRYSATIKESETKPDSATLTYRTILTMPAPEGVEILAGLNAKVHIDMALLSAVKPRIQIPLEAVFNPQELPIEEGFGYVWLLDPKTMTISQRRVAIGPITDFGIVISEGLGVGDSIIGAGVHMLTAGAQVRPMAREMGL
jgi:RND family efflux transporter MFP subunit